MGRDQRKEASVVSSKQLKETWEVAWMPEEPKGLPHSVWLWSGQLEPGSWFLAAAIRQLSPPSGHLPLPPPGEYRIGRNAPV